MAITHVILFICDQCRGTGKLPNYDEQKNPVEVDCFRCEGKGKVKVGYLKEKEPGD